MKKGGKGMFNSVEDVIKYLESRKKKDISYLDINKWEVGYGDGLSEAIVALEILVVNEEK